MRTRPSPIGKKRSSGPVNGKTLAQLLTATFAIGFMPTEGVMADALKAQADAQQKKGVYACQNVIGQLQQHLQQTVENLRTTRKQERLAAKKVADLNRAFHYFVASGNPLPAFKESGSTGNACDFCRELGIAMPESNDDAWNVPTSFTVPDVKVE